MITPDHRDEYSILMVDSVLNLPPHAGKTVHFSTPNGRSTFAERAFSYIRNKIYIPTSIAICEQMVAAASIRAAKIRKQQKETSRRVRNKKCSRRK